MADPVLHLTNGVPDLGTGNVTTLGQVLDPTNGPAAIKAASTAPVAADKALVVGAADGNIVTMGITTGAAVVTDVAGTVQQYLRGLVKLIAAGINVVVSNANPNGRAVPGSSAPVVLNSMTYVTVAASTTQQCGATGASGDYLDGVLIIPGTAAAGIVQIKDGSGSAITIFAGGGTTALPTLAPFYVPIGAISSGGVGGWKVITLANETAIAFGNFT